MSEAGDRLVWLDLEMTGLVPEEHVIVEIATLITDAELNLIAEGPDLVCHATEEELGRMAAIVVDMHTKSGLLAQVRASTLTVAEAEAQTLAFVKEHCPMQGQNPLCGNSIGTDKRFLLRHMPALIGHLSYRIVDVSTVKELARRWYPRKFGDRPKKGEGHRALHDVRESVEELAYYREALFVPRADGADDAG